MTTTNHQLRPRFSLGQVVATSGVIQIMEDAGINPAALLRRHVSGDWGDIHPEDDGLNEEALETGARILSVYGTADDPTGCGSSPRPTAAPPRPSVPRTTDIGMDVCGKAPTSETGEYFRNNVWWWCPLWDYCAEVAPDLTEGISGHYNDGDGLDAAGAHQLAAMLTAEIETGRTSEFAEKYTADLAALPDEPCWLCNGAGTRTDELAVAQGWTQRGGCISCQGTGKVRPDATSYPFSAENVAEFRDFVAASGGFEIW